MSAIVVVIALSTARFAAAQAAPRGTGPLNVAGPVRVIDGDTLEVYIDGRQTAIGVIGIKAPQGNTPCGRRAAQLFETLINRVAPGPEAGPVLRFEEDLNHTFDARKRRMYYLKLPDGVSPALELVRAGLADPNGDGEERDELDLAASRASRCAR
jgi:endonuclease YncB( thermonuclease family)